MIDRRTFLLTPFVLAAAERRPSILLLDAGQWRGQATPWAGDPDLVAPNLDKLGSAGVAFSRAYSCYPSAGPARTGLATGRFPHAVTSEDVRLGDTLKTAGYRVEQRGSGTAMEFLEANREAPFFMTVTLDPPRSVKPYDPARLHPRGNVPSNGETGARKEMAERYGVYTALDDIAGRLMGALDRLGIANDTIVVFTAACGEQLGSQGLEGGDVPFEESVRIPLAIRYRRALPQPEITDRLASLVDIVPTLLALCGEPIPESVQGSDLRGERRESVYAEGKIGQKDEWRMVVQGSDKLVFDAQTEATQLYNLVDDPYELTNLAHDSAMQLKRDELLAVARASMGRFADFRRR